jgi:arsenate reductase-like glutaredoxin family protein
MWPGRDLSDERLIEVMAKYPGLIQRPIVVKGDEAVLARPTENSRNSELNTRVIADLDDG